MAFPAPTEPSSGSVSATAESRNRLAIGSFLFSLVPPVVWVLFYAIAALTQLHTPNTNGVTAQDTTRYALALLVYVVSLIAGIGAIAVGVQAMRRARHVPPRQARRSFAIAGLVMGSADTACVICPGTLVVYVLYLCTTGPCS